MEQGKWLNKINSLTRKPFGKNNLGFCENGGPTSALCLLREGSKTNSEWKRTKNNLKMINLVIQSHHIHVEPEKCNLRV